MHEWKRRSILNIRKWYRSEADHYAARFGDGDRFWQPKYYSFEINGRQKLEEKLRYTYLNPERAGLSGRWTGVGVPLGGMTGEKCGSSDSVGGL